MIPFQPLTLALSLTVSYFSPISASPAVSGATGVDLTDIYARLKLPPSYNLTDLTDQTSVPNSVIEIPVPLVGIKILISYIEGSRTFISTDNVDYIVGDLAKWFGHFSPDTLCDAVLQNQWRWAPPALQNLHMDFQPNPYQVKIRIGKTYRDVMFALLAIVLHLRQYGDAAGLNREFVYRLNSLGIDYGGGSMRIKSRRADGADDGIMGNSTGNGLLPLSGPGLRLPNNTTPQR